MVSKRSLNWSSCVNARDLGGLPTTDGGTVRAGALIRSDTPERLDAAGWQALSDHGVRTVIDLRNDDERAGDAAPRPREIDTLVLEHDGIEEDLAFWEAMWPDPRYGTPGHYFTAHLERFPHRSARVLQAIAHARPGGVLVHCQGGRDRTGLICALALTVAGAEPDAIADDYALSFEGDARQPSDAKILAALDGATPREALLDVLTATDLHGALARGGLTEDDAIALRARLVAPAGRGT